jgi:pimeloyl-ACP methyl ester carboxylesterase
MTTLLRSGKYTGTLGTPLKIVHVGHSFGSYLTNALIATTPALSDAAILTGMAYGENSGPLLEAFGLRIATELAPGRWNGRDNEYLTWVDAFANAATFYYPNSYDKEVLWYTEDVKQPLAAIELLTIGALRFNAPNFAGPVVVSSDLQIVIKKETHCHQVISGEFDLAVCGRDCNGLLEQGIKEAYFPNATDFQGIVHPGVGHGINFSYNATGAYVVMINYLKKQGL